MAFLLQVTITFIIYRIDDNESKWLQVVGSVQDCSDSSAVAMRLLQFCIKPSICWLGEYLASI